MADYLCTILDSRILTNFTFSVPRSSPQAPCIPLPAFSFDNPRTARRRRKKSLYLNLFSINNQEPTLAIPSSSNVDIISCHEHSDGSLIFRFGDPSEVAKNDVPKESDASIEEVGSEGKEEHSVVKVLDGEYEREVIVKRIEREEGSQVINKEAEIANSVVAIGSGSSRVTDESSESSEKLLEDPDHAGFPVSASSTEVEKIETEEGCQESYEAVDVPSSVLAIGCEGSRVIDEVSQSSEKQFEEPEHVPLHVSTSSTEIQKIEREEESQESNAAAAANSMMAICSESSDVTNVVSESSDKLLEDTKEVQLHVSEAGTGVGDSSSSVVDIENSRHDEEIPSTVSVLEKIDELENGGTYGEVLEKFDNEEVLQSIPMKSNFDTESRENNRNQEHTLGDFEFLDSSVNAEDQGVESVPQNVPEDSGDRYANEVILPSRCREAEPILDEEAENNTIQEFNEDTTENLSTINGVLPNRTLEAEKSSNHLQSNNLPEVSEKKKSTDLEADTNVNKFPISDLPEVSNHELMELKTTGVSFPSKQIPTPEFVFSSAAALLPHPSKVLTGGEDAYFIASQNWLGIADGVDQWSLEGTIPGVYAQELMDNCEKIVSDGNRSLLTNPEEVLRLSVAESQSHGLSTVLIAHFDGQVLNIANIGDSGFIILRNGAVHKKSSPMFHEFCFPVQIESGDDPSQLSQGYQVELDEGDIIVIATNGLFDNLYDQEIASIVSKSVEDAKGPKEIAEVLATMAQEVGSSASARSPFADAAQAAGYAGYAGGKLDGVAVIVSMVQKSA